MITKNRTIVHIVGSGEYVADTAVVAEYMQRHNRAYMVYNIIDAWGKDCFKRTAKSKPASKNMNYRDDRIALNTLPTYVLAVILNQL